MSEFNIEVQGGSSVRLPTAGKYCEKDIIVTASGGGTPKPEQEKSIDITENGTTEVLPDEGSVLSKVTVNVDVASGGEDDFIGIKYSNYDYYNSHYLPQTVDARSLDKLATENSHMLDYMCCNSNTNSNGGYFINLKEAYLPSNATTLFDTFWNCRRLENIYGDLSNITSISGGFGNCTSLENVSSLLARMTKLQAIASSGFANCTQITELKLPSSITSIHSKGFTGCTNITDIYCPWAEGAVANAPWGATNATIHYNWVEEENTNAES